MGTFGLTHVACCMHMYYIGGRGAFQVHNVNLPFPGHSVYTQRLQPRFP